jgi:hypothetical protein
MFHKTTECWLFIWFELQKDKMPLPEGRNAVPAEIIAYTIRIITSWVYWGVR